MSIGLKNLCTPAYLYLVISTISILVMAMQNFGNRDVYCVGKYQCQTNGLLGVFMIKIIYVVFWTWILNIICRSGYTSVSWFLVLIPFILFFLMVAMYMLALSPVDRYTNAEYWYRKAL